MWVTLIAALGFAGAGFECGGVVVALRGAWQQVDRQEQRGTMTNKRVLRGCVWPLKRVAISPMKFATFPLVVLLALVSWASGQVTDGQWTYIVENGGATIVGSTATGAVTIPSVLGGFAVKKVGNGQLPPVFGNTNASVTSVNIPDSVTSIGEFAFYGCTGLTSVSIPNSVTSIGEFAFANCTGLTSVSIPNSVTSIGRSVFYGCTGLTSVNIGSGVTSIGVAAFFSCIGLTSVNIPDSVTSIGSDAFNGCTGLTSIYFRGDMPAAGDAIFRNIDPAGIVYYLISSTGWGDTYAGWQTASYIIEPKIAIYNYRGNARTLGGEASLLVTAAGSLVIDLNTDQATYIGLLAFGTGGNRVRYFQERPFDNFITTQVSGPRGTSYTVLAKAVAPETPVDGIVMQQVQAVGLNSNVTIRTLPSPLRWILPRTFKSTSLTITDEYGADYLARENGTYTLNDKATTAYNNAGLGVGDFVTFMRNFYTERGIQKLPPRPS